MNAIFLAVIRIAFAVAGVGFVAIALRFLTSLHEINARAIGDLI